MVGYCILDRNRISVKNLLFTVPRKRPGGVQHCEMIEWAGRDQSFTLINNFVKFKDKNIYFLNTFCLKCYMSTIGLFSQLG